MPAFHDVCFPLAIGLRASGGPEFATQVSTSARATSSATPAGATRGSASTRASACGRMTTWRRLLAFFRARRGRANAFRFTDPFDHSSRDDGGAPTATDQRLGTGDGVATRFPLVKWYGLDAEPYARRITRPQPGTIVVAVDGVATAPGRWATSAPSTSPSRRRPGRPSPPASPSTFPCASTPTGSTPAPAAGGRATSPRSR